MCENLYVVCENVLFVLFLSVLTCDTVQNTHTHEHVLIYAVSGLKFAMLWGLNVKTTDGIVTVGSGAVCRFDGHPKVLVLGVNAYASRKYVYLLI